MGQQNNYVSTHVWYGINQVTKVSAILFTYIPNNKKKIINVLYVPLSLSGGLIYETSILFTSNMVHKKSKSLLDKKV